MSDENQVIDNRDFWTQLEFDASRQLETSEDKNLRQFWVDGFLPETFTSTRQGMKVEGIVWIGKGGRDQFQYRFSASLPREMTRGQKFLIGRLVLDQEKQTLKLVIVSPKSAMVRSERGT